MADINQEARIPVYINDEQAKSALKNLTSESEKWRKKMFEAMSAGDLTAMKEAERELKKVNGQMNSIKKEAFDVNKVLSNIADASTKDLKKALQAVNKEMDGLNRNSKEYKDLMGKRNQIKEEVTKINGPIKEQAGLLGNIKSLLPALGWGAMAAGAVVAFTKIKDSTDTLSTQWEIFISGLNQATNEFWRTLATGNWTNFIGRMREAIEVGREYAATLDDLEEKSRALRIIEADARAKELELEIKLRNKTLSNEERRKAGQERIQLEKDLSEKRTALAKEEYNNELMRTMQETKLSKDQLEKVMRDFDSLDKAEAKRYLQLQDNYESTLQLSEKFKVAQSRTGISENPYLKQLEYQQKVLNSFPESIRLYAIAVKAQGETTDPQLNKTTDAWVKLKEAQNSAVENIPRIITQVNSLLAAEKKETEENGTDLEDKYLKDQKKLEDAVRKETNIKKIALNKQLENAEISQEEYSNKMQLLELAHLESLKMIYIAGGRDTTEIELNISQARLNITQKFLQEKEKKEADSDEKTKKRLEKLKQEFEDIRNSFEKNQKFVPEGAFVSLNKLTEEYTNNLNSELSQLEQTEYFKTAAVEEQEKIRAEIRKRNNDEYISHVQSQAMNWMDIAGNFGDMVGDFFAEQELSLAAFGKSILTFSLDILEKQLEIQIAAATIQSLTTPDSVLSFGASGIARAAILIGLMKAAFGAVKGLINGTGSNKKAESYSSGGYTAPGGKFQPAGIVHAGEYVIPQEGVNNAKLRPIIDLIEIARRNRSLARLDIRPVVASVPSGQGYSSGGYTSNLTESASSLQGSGNILSLLAGRSSAVDNKQNEVLMKLAEAVDRLVKKDLSVSVTDIKNGLDRREDIDKNSGL